MSTLPQAPRALLHLLFNGARAVEVVETALELGLLDALEPGPVTLDELSARYGLVPLRLFKLLDCLESLGLVRREQSSDAPREARYSAVPGLRAAAQAVLGPHSQERDREGHAWREVYGHLPEVLRGERSLPPEHFAWPPRTPEQTAAFEASMAVGLGPLLEVFRLHGPRLFREGMQLLDVGGGNGTLAAHLLEWNPGLRVDVYNLPLCGPLVERTRSERALEGRLGFVAGDFFREPLPRGYDALSFVRVLHDWPRETARALLRAAHEALPPGGRLLICEEFRTPERLAGQFFWTWFTIGLDSFVGGLREVDFYVQALGELGFREVQILPGPCELITALRGA